MTKIELIKTITNFLKDSEIRKPVRKYKKVFHLSDDDGNSKDFVASVTDKTVGYTSQDVENILDALTQVICEAITNGDSVSIRSFGTFGLKYWKPRMMRNVVTGEMALSKGEYRPYFKPAVDLKMAAKIYGQMLETRGIDLSAAMGGDSDGFGDELD